MRARSRVAAVAVAATAFALVWATYCNTFSNSFHYDDFHTIVDNRHIRDLGNVIGFFSDPETFASISERAMFRPVVTTSFAVNYRLGLYDVFGYHVANFFLHLSCGLLLFLLARSIGLTRIQAGIGALLFVVHPVQTEAVNYISSRSESLAALFFLAALTAYVRWRSIGETDRSDGHGAQVLYVASVGSFVGALASKSTSLALPVVLLLFEAALRRRAGKGWSLSRLVRYHSPFWALSAAYLFIVRSSAGVALGQPVRGLDEQILSQFKAFIYYAKLLFMPVSLSVDHQFSAADTPSVPAILGGAVLASLLLAGGAMYRNRQRGGSAPLLGWSLAALLPASLVPLNVLVNEHRLYLPVAIASLWIVGFVLSTVGDPHSWRTGSRSVRLWGVGVALAVLALLAHDRNRAWATELTLWQDAVDKAPGMYRPHMHLGGAMETAGKWEAARAAYERAVEIDPSVALVRHQLGALYKASGKQEAAMTAYREGILLDPPRVESHYNLANLYFDMGKLDDSRRSYESALALQPDHRGARYNLADVYARLGQFRKAEAICLEALAEAQPDGRFHLLLAKVRESLAK
jgi:tetratricopeptide (TPR) repeat protein